MFNSIGQQLSKCKTSIRRNMVDPEFNETFVFQIIEFELPSVSIMFSVVNIKKMRRKEIIGWFSIGHDSTGNEEDAHWRAVMNARGQPIRRWHILSSVDFWAIVRAPKRVLCANQKTSVVFKLYLGNV